MTSFGGIMDFIQVEICHIKKNFFNVFSSLGKVLILGARLEANFAILERVGTVG